MYIRSMFVLLLCPEGYDACPLHLTTIATRHPQTQHAVPREVAVQNSRCAALKRQCALCELILNGERV